MDMVIRGRRITTDDLATIRNLIAAHPHRKRRFLSQELCRIWQWRQANGAVKDAAARALLLKLHRQGLIQLPLAQRAGFQRSRSSSATQLLLSLNPVPPSPPPLLSFPTELHWRLAQAGHEFHLYKELVQTHHYLGYKPAVGPVLRYLIYAQGQPIACFSWAAAAWKVAVRDQFIGWTVSQRQKNLGLVIDNTRFLILDRFPHLASKLLAGTIRRLPIDWHRTYGVTPVLLETFVDTTRFKGTCYKAANWIYLGLTQGRGKNDRHHFNDKPIKAIFVYPLDKQFREALTRE